MFTNHLYKRFLYTTFKSYAIDKSLLATLRKKTGYTFANCKKALEINNNDLIKAEKWLQEQAQSLGWSKATKLEGRQTKQGLIGVCTSHGHAVLAEVNCETDFVARNDTFKQMVGIAARACLSFAESNENTGSLRKFELNSEEFKKLRNENGKSLSDELALTIGSVGENLNLRRAFGFKAPEDVLLSYYVHPGDVKNEGVTLGKFAALLAFRQRERNENVKEIARNICQHIVGMRPLKIGSDEDKPSQDIDDEVCLIHQEYVADNSVLVKDVLEENGIEVVDFKRFECGEILEEQLEERLHVCQ